MLKIKQFTFSPIQENTYILYNEFGQCAIIDPGCYFDEEKEALANFIGTQKLNPILLLNTHCHLDHVFGNKFVAEKYNLLPHLHPEEEKMLQAASSSGLMYNMPFDSYIGPLIFIAGGQTLKIGDDVLDIIEAPGHSPGHVCFYCKDQHFLIGGDVLFEGSIGRTDLPFGNHQQLLDNINQHIFTLPENTKVFSGHGRETTVGKEKRNNPFFN